MSNHDRPFQSLIGNQRMRILLAGGIYSLSPAARARKRPAPEEVLEAALRAAGEEVHAISLKDFKAGLSPSRYDIVHVHHMSKMAVIQALVPRPMVFTPHSSTYGPSIRRRNVERLVWTRSDAIVCLSRNEMREKVARFPRLVHKLHVIPNGIPQLAAEHKPALRRWREGDPFNIALVGQLIGVKRVHLAIRALAELPSNVRLSLSYHNNFLESDLKDLARDLGVVDRVFFLGQAGGDELYDRFASAHLLLMPSYAEALPSVVSEALISGCPVVATDVGGIAEQVGEEAGLLVDRDTADYSAAVETAMAGYARLAHAALKRGQEIERAYSPESMARRHIELYRSVLETE